jgi:hypothetical protein
MGLCLILTTGPDLDKKLRCWTSHSMPCVGMGWSLCIKIVDRRVGNGAAESKAAVGEVPPRSFILAQLDLWWSTTLV